MSYKISKFSASPETINSTCIRSLSVSSNSADQIIGGNHDLLIKLFAYLPATTLSVCKSVCKQWESVISSAYFSKYRTLHPRQPQHLFILDSSQLIYFNPRSETAILPFTFIHAHTKILQSSHELLLLECKETLHGLKQYYVYNSTTKQYRDLYVKSTGLSGLFLAYDPSKSSHYRVVSIRLIDTPYGRPCKYRYRVYDSVTHEWEDDINIFTINGRVNLRNGIYLNNRIYWMRFGVRSFVLDLKTGVLETLPVLQARVRNMGDRVKNYVMESNGRIHRVSLQIGPTRKSLLVHEMSGGGLDWFEKFYVDFRRISSVFDEVNLMANVMGIIRGEKDGDSTVWLHVPEKIFSLKFSDGKFEVAKEFCKISSKFVSKNACHFIEI